MMKVYLDNCCYNRPFDDRSNIKNYLEREAVLIVLQMAFDGNIRIVGSEILEKEMSLIRNGEKRCSVESLYNGLKSSTVYIDSSIIQRSDEIVAASSIRRFDSLHLAAAEAEADVLLTTDIKFMKAAKRLGVRVKVQNPIEFVLEVNENEHDN